MARGKNTKVVRSPDGGIENVERQFTRAAEYWKPDRRSMIAAGRYFWAENYGQWPDYVVAELLAEQREPPTLNIIGDKIKISVGQLMKNKLEVKFEPISTDVSAYTMLIQDMWYHDYELNDWDTSWIYCARDGHIMCGYEQMIVTDKPDGDPLGHIAFIHRNPFDITLDPDWKSNYTRDLRRYWVHPVLSVEEIKEIYPNKIEEMEEEFERQKAEGKNYGENKIYPDVEIATRWGDNHQVIELHELREERSWQEWDVKNKTWFPEGTTKDKIIYAAKMGLTDDDIQQYPRKQLVYYVETCCPTLSKNLWLEKRKHEIQIDRLDLFPWGLMRYNGHYKGLPSILKDLQQNINKSVMDMTDIRQRAARGSPGIFDPSIVENDEVKMKNIESNINKPGFFEWSKSGALAGGASNYILPIPQSAIPQDLSWFTQFLFESAEKLSVPAASEGRTESSKESGRLFQSKYEAALIAQGEMYKTMEIHEAEKAEAYLKQAKITYAGSEREFAGRGGKAGFKVNVKKPMEDGTIGIENDITKLPRYKVQITQSPKGLNVRTNQRMQMADLLHSMPRNLTTTPVITMQGIFETYEMSDEMRVKSKQALDSDLKTAMSINERTQVENELMKYQAEMQLNAIKAQGAGAMAQQQLPAPTQITPGTEELNPEMAIAGTPQEKNMESQLLNRQPQPPA